MATVSGNRSAIDRVTTPVPAATSSSEPGPIAASRSASAVAYGWKMSGTM